MGYFSNGTEGDSYIDSVCSKCVNHGNVGGCPCMMAHVLWNYEECNKPDSILHKMIPRTKEGNGKCIFFFEKSDET